MIVTKNPPVVVDADPSPLEEVLRPATVYAAIAQVMSKIGPVAKTELNKQSNFYYRGIDQILNALQPAMAEAGLVIFVHEILSIEYKDVIVGAKRTAMQSVRVKVRFKMVGPDGTFDFGEMVGESFDSGDKATGKAITYAEKAFILTTFKIPVEDNRDPDADTYERNFEPEGQTYGQDAEEEQPAKGWKQLFDEAVAKGVPALREFIQFATANNAPAVAVHTAQEALDEMVAQERKAAQAGREGQQGPRNEGTSEARAEATKSVVPEPDRPQG